MSQKQIKAEMLAKLDALFGKTAAKQHKTKVAYQKTEKAKTFTIKEMTDEEVKNRMLATRVWIPVAQVKYYHRQTCQACDAVATFFLGELTRHQYYNTSTIWEYKRLPEHKAIDLPLIIIEELSTIEMCLDCAKQDAHTLELRTNTGDFNGQTEET